MSKSLNNFEMETFDSRAELEETLTKNISSQLKNSITETGGASLMVSGGSTPVILFKRLAQTKLAWQRVFVGLVDERWVPPNHQDSNEKLLRENLLQYKAALPSRTIGCPRHFPFRFLCTFLLLFYQSALSLDRFT